MIHIYCGDGKGKTTAAIGLAVRFAGRFGKCGGRVIIARFLKDEDSGEVDVLRQIPGIRVLNNDRSFGFTWKMTELQKKEASEYYGELLKKACEMAMSEALADGNAGVLLILDEAMAAVNSGLVSEDVLADAIEKLENRVEIVLTGRNPSERIKDMADYISCIDAEKHPFEKGVGAREGIEY